jgi:hypothetical protein
MSVPQKQFSLNSSSPQQLPFVEALIKDGCKAIYLWGIYEDSLVAQGKLQ